MTPPYLYEDGAITGAALKIIERDGAERARETATAFFRNQMMGLVRWFAEMYGLSTEDPLATFLAGIMLHAGSEVEDRIAAIVATQVLMLTNNKEATP